MQIAEKDLPPKIRAELARRRKKYLGRDASGAQKIAIKGCLDGEQLFDLELQLLAEESKRERLSLSEPGTMTTRELDEAVARYHASEAASKPRPAPTPVSPPTPIAAKTLRTETNRILRERFGTKPYSAADLAVAQNDAARLLRNEAPSVTMETIGAATKRIMRANPGMSFERAQNQAWNEVHPTKEIDQ